MTSQKLDGHAKRSVETVKKLTRAGRKAFARQGFHDASTPAIAKAAGVSRGALYHQFPDKTALFKAVVQQMQIDLFKRIEKIAVESEDVLEALTDGAYAYIEAASEHDYMMIVMTEGPSVLGLETWRELDRTNGVESLIQGLEVAKSQGRLVGGEPETMAYLVSGALDQAVFFVALSENREQALAEMKAAIQVMLSGVVKSSGKSNAQLSFLD